MDFNNYIESIGNSAKTHMSIGSQVIFNAMAEHCDGMLDVIEHFLDNKADFSLEYLKNIFAKIAKEEQRLELWCEDFGKDFGNYWPLIDKIKNEFKTDKLEELVNKMYDSSFKEYDKSLKIEDFNKKLKKFLTITVNKNRGEITKIEKEDKNQIKDDDLKFLENKKKIIKALRSKIPSLKTNFTKAARELMAETENLRGLKELEINEIEELAESFLYDAKGAWHYVNLHMSSTETLIEKLKRYNLDDNNQRLKNLINNIENCEKEIESWCKKLSGYKQSNSPDIVNKMYNFVNGYRQTLKLDYLKNDEDLKKNSTEKIEKLKDKKQTIRFIRGTYTKQKEDIEKELDKLDNIK